MSNLQAEAEFFRDIAETVIAFVRDSAEEMVVAEDKGPNDYATQVDIDVENLIVAEIQKRFPGDQILAEEGFADTAISTGRIWIIDPICGTGNLGKGISTFCTNIALAENKQVIASCVVDHSQGEFIWSMGQGTVFVNDRPVRPPASLLGIKVDVDLGALKRVTKGARQKYFNCLLKITNETNYEVCSFNTSLGFAYTATGKIDGFINVSGNPWDKAAACFLIQQVGGVVTDIDGSPWSIESVGTIGGRTPEIHKKLLNLYTGT